MSFKDALLLAIEQSKLTKEKKDRLRAFANQPAKMAAMQKAASGHARLRHGAGAIDWSKMINLLIELLPVILALFA